MKSGSCRSDRLVMKVFTNTEIYIYGENDKHLAEE